MDEKSDKAEAMGKEKAPAGLQEAEYDFREKPVSQAYLDQVLPDHIRATKPKTAE